LTLLLYSHISIASLSLRKATLPFKTIEFILGFVSISEVWFDVYDK